MKSKDDIQDLALKAIGDRKRCSVAVSMGVGKTLIGLRHMSKRLSENGLFLIVAPKKSIFQSWKDDAVKFGMEHLLEYMRFTTYISLHKQDQSLYDGVYLDECHSLKHTHWHWLSTYEGNILGLTGTPPKHEKSEKAEMMEEFCPVVYKYVVDSAVDDKILNDYRIVLHPVEMDTNKNLRVENNGRVWFTSEEATYDYWTNRLDNAKNAKEVQIMRIMRMKALMDFPSKDKYVRHLFSQIREKCILFANTHEQADKLCTHSYHSSNPKSEDNLIKFKSGEINKLSAVLQLNEGVNIPNLREGIIMHAYGNERKSSQRIGRLLRLNPDETATVHILYYKNTIDEIWVRKALEDFDSDKIIWK